MVKLIKCKACEKEVSKKAKACPHCGEPIPKQLTLGEWIQGLFGIIVIGLVVYACSGDNEEGIKSTSTTKESKQLTPEEKRQQDIESYFSGWDGSHRNLAKMVKEALHDPDSYEHESTTYFDNGDHLIINMHYRAKNAFGGRVKSFVKAKVDLYGNVLEILDQY